MPTRSSILFALTMLLGLLSIGALRGQTEETGIEEISVGFVVPDMGSILLPALIDDESKLYLSTMDIFSYIRVKMDIDESGLDFSGFLLEEGKLYEVSGTERKIVVDGREYNLGEDQMIVTEERVFLRNDMFQKIFEIECRFNFRNLDVTLHTDLILPAVRDAKRERARRNLHQLITRRSFDKQIKGGRGIVGLGTLDWSLYSSLDSSGNANVAYGASLGFELLGGGLELQYSGDKATAPKLSDVSWDWHYINNDWELLRQITIGDVPTMLPDPVGSSARGVFLTNQSSVDRSHYGLYTIADQTEPEWTVELYVGELLVDVVKADADGYFQFEVPVRYGSTPLTLRFFGPWGEERSEEKTVQIPFEFLPPGQVEYSASGGFLNNSVHEFFGQGNLRVGINSSMSLEGGIGATTDNWFPFLSGSFRLMESVLMAGTYSLKYGGEATLRWNPSTKVSVDVALDRYNRGVASRGEDYVQNARVLLSSPLDIGILRGRSALQLLHRKVSDDNRIEGKGKFAGRMLGLPLSIALQTEWDDDGGMTIRSLKSEVRTMLRPWDLGIIRPSVELDLMRGGVIATRLEFERRLFEHCRIRGGLAYKVADRTPLSGELGLKFDLPFARLNIAGTQQANSRTLRGSMSGSVVYDPEEGTLFATKKGNTGRASLTIYPFLDINNNDVRDEGEPLIPDVTLGINGGIIRRSSSDTAIHVINLEPHRPYVLTIGEAGLPEISWRPKNSTLEVMGGPNRFRVIDVPIVVAGEVNGKIVREDGKTCPAGLIVRFEQIDGTFSDSVLTYEEGEFFYLGLPPGEYTASLDEEQLRLLGLSLPEEEFRFTISSGMTGDIVDDLFLTVK